MAEKPKEHPAPAEKEIRETAEILFRPSWIRESPSVWPGIREALKARAFGLEAVPRPVRPIPAVPFPFRCWAVAAGLAAVFALGLALLGFRSFTLKSGMRPVSIRAAAGPEPRVEILSSILAGSPAQAFLFQTSEISYVWLAPIERTEKKK
jgi:hypothetical protein